MVDEACCDGGCGARDDSAAAVAARDYDCRVLPLWGVDVGEVSLEVSDMTAWGWGEGEGEEWSKYLEMKAVDRSHL